MKNKNEDSKVVPTPAALPVVEPSPPAPEFLEEVDKHNLNLVKLQQQLSVAQAEKSLAQNELAKANYDNFVLRLTFKYGLKQDDLITEQGEIKRGATQ